MVSQGRNWEVKKARPGHIPMYGDPPSWLTCPLQALPLTALCRQLGAGASTLTAVGCDSRDLMKRSVFLCGPRRQSSLLLGEDSRRNQAEQSVGSRQLEFGLPGSSILGNKWPVFISHQGVVICYGSLRGLRKTWRGSLTSVSTGCWV